MKKYRLEIFLSPLFLLLSSYVFSVLLSFNILEPIRQTISDFDITDLSYQIVEKEKVGDDRIVIIDVGKYSQKKLYYMLNIIAGYQPRAIGIDIPVLKEKDGMYNDSLLKICKRFKSIVFASSLEKYDENHETYLGIMRSWGKYLQYARSGFNNLPYGLDKRYFTVRDFRPFTNVMGVKEYSFAYQVASIYDSTATTNLLKRKNESERIYYSGNAEIFTFLSSRQVLLNDFDENLLKDKIILIGNAPIFNPTLQLDFMRFTPFSSSDAGRPLPDMYSTVIQANIIKMILDRKYYKIIPEFWTMLFTLLLVYVNVWIFYLISDKIPLWYEILSNVLFLIQSILILALILVLYFDYNIYADINIALLALALVIIVFEAYRDSIVPFIKNIFIRIIQRSSK